MPARLKALVVDDERLARSHVVHPRGVAEPIAMSRRYAGELRARFS